MNRTRTPIPSLGDFQRAFAAALLAADTEPQDAAGPLRELVSQPGFAVYRNTVATACVDALRAGYATVRALVGDEWFAEAALAFVRTHPPREPMLVDYGEGFAAFLTSFPPAEALAWLADVARADRFRTEAHCAADAAPIDAQRVARVGVERIGTARLRLHPSARWAWFDAGPIAAIWLAHCAPASDAAVDGVPDVDLRGIDWKPGGLLVVRARDAVHGVALDRAACAFLDACGRAATIADAAGAALAADAAADLSAMMGALLEVGAFAELQLEETLP